MDLSEEFEEQDGLLANLLKGEQEHEQEIKEEEEEYKENLFDGVRRPNNNDPHDIEKISRNVLKEVSQEMSNRISSEVSNVRDQLLLEFRGLKEDILKGVHNVMEHEECIKEKTEAVQNIEIRLKKKKGQIEMATAEIANLKVSNIELDKKHKQNMISEEGKRAAVESHNRDLLSRLEEKEKELEATRNTIEKLEKELNAEKAKVRSVRLAISGEIGDDTNNNIQNEKRSNSSQEISTPASKRPRSDPQVEQDRKVDEAPPEMEYCGEGEEAMGTLREKEELANEIKNAFQEEENENNGRLSLEDFAASTMGQITTKKDKRR